MFWGIKAASEIMYPLLVYGVKSGMKNIFQKHINLREIIKKILLCLINDYYTIILILFVHIRMNLG